MLHWQSSSNKYPGSRVAGTTQGFGLAAACLQIVDASLLGILFLAPFFFGGWHPLGRLVLILLASLAGVAWFTRQALLEDRKWTRTWANVLGLAVLLLVVLQLIPLPEQWLAQLAPRNSALLTMWTGDARAVSQLGIWKTLSLSPSETQTALATLVAYALLFTTTVGRLEQLSDIERVLRMLALATILMAGFGILQYFTSNGLFLWTYEYPNATTDQAAKGSFPCQNHFAHFLVLGFGPLFAWVVLQLRDRRQKKTQWQQPDRSPKTATSVVLHASLGMVVLAVLLSLSRGGAVALAVVSTITVAIYCRHGLLSGTYLYGLAMLGLVVVGTLSMSGYERVAGRLDDFASVSLESLDNNGGRRKIWAANLAAIQEGSLFGSGAGSHRDIYPVYATESQNREYIYAENGFLQIATETGLLGIGLLALAMVMVGGWCWRALRSAASTRALILAGAATASLAASAVHSAVDFVWFIPSCMSLTIILAACVLRLAQLAVDASRSKASSVPWARWRWLGLAAAASGVAAWATTMAIGPAAASIHWDRYLLSTQANNKHTFQQLTADEPGSIDATDQQSRTAAAVSHLRNALARSPRSARAHLRLAAKYLQQFGQQQQVSDNAMSVDQIRAAALASSFPSAQALQEWLRQAFGDRSRLLYQAHFHARQAVLLSPLQGKAYLYLANLCFLEGPATEAIDAYLAQGLRVRPHDGPVLFEAGRQRLVLEQSEQAFSLWQQIYGDPGIHQLKIVHLLAGQVPAAAFIELFEPNWQTLPYVWQRYRERGGPADWAPLLDYAESAARQQCPKERPPRAANIWFSLAKMQCELSHDDAALESMRLAVQKAPNKYDIRQFSGLQLLEMQRYRQAEPHLRWCLARRPDDAAVRKALVQATKSRLRSTTTTVDSQLK